MKASARGEIRAFALRETCQHTAIFCPLRHQALAGDAGARASRGQRGQHVALDRGILGRRALPAGLSGVPERDHAFPRGDRGLLRQGLPLRAAHQPLAAALRQDLSHKYVFLSLLVSFHDEKNRVSKLRGISLRKVESSRGRKIESDRQSEFELRHLVGQKVERSRNRTRLYDVYALLMVEKLI